MTTSRKLNKIADFTSTTNLSFDSLEIGKPYNVLGYSILGKTTIRNKVSECVRMDIEGGYLIFVRRFDEGARILKMLNMDKLCMIYHGRGEKGKGLDVEFGEREREIEGEKQHQ